MAKYRHRTFEMFEFFDEAVTAVAPRSSRDIADTTDPGLWTFEQFETSRSSGVTLITFKSPEKNAEDAVAKICDELALISRSLGNNSRVVMDFEGLAEITPSAIDALALFNRTLLSKGSLLVLCKLEADVKAAFFPPR